MTRRLYARAPRSEVNYIQAIVDAHEGLARIRTERQDGDSSLLLFMVEDTREPELRQLLTALSLELTRPVEFI